MNEKINTGTKKLKNLPAILKSYYRLRKNGKYDDIDEVYNNLLRLQSVYGKKASYYENLANLAYRKKEWRLAIEHMNIAAQLEDEFVKKTYLLKADCFLNLNEIEEAISCWQRYLDIEPTDFSIWYRLANEYEKLKKWREAAENFESYLQLSPTDSKAYLQLAECYRKLSETKKAEESYQKTVQNLNHHISNQELALVYYKLGLTQQQNNIESNTSYNKAIELDNEFNSQRFGIGVFHDLYKEWGFAIESYKNQLHVKNEDAELLFKLASLLDKTHQPEEAVYYYEKALQLDKVRSPWHFALANCYEQLEDYENAAKWYGNAIERQEKHRPGNYRRLGHVLNQLGKTREALEAYEEAEIFRKPSSVGKKFYEKNIRKHEVRYAISYEHFSVNETTILYRTSGGKLTDNPYAIFEYLMNDSNFDDFTHVWVVESFQVVPDEWKGFDNVVFTKKNSDSSKKYLSIAKYLICNAKLPNFFVRKPKQLYLQTSHGIFYKTMGREQKNSPVGSIGGTHNLLQATHIIMPNEFMVQKQSLSYSIRGIYSGKAAKIGYPRIDSTLNSTDNIKNERKLKLGIDPSKKTVLYAPTWRGSLSNKKMDSEMLVNDLNNLAQLDINMVFRGHTFSNQILKGVKLPKNVIVPQAEVQTNELLSVTDILITDYSSIFFDFLATERPIIHYLYDIEEYKQERGLNLLENELPGSVAKTSDQLIQQVSNGLTDSEPSPHYLRTKDRFCPYDDGQSTHRVVQWFFYGNEKDITFAHYNEYETSYLYLGGELRNKKELKNLTSKLNELEENGEIVSILLEKNISKDMIKRQFLKELNENINFIPHDKIMSNTMGETEAIRYFNINGQFKDDKMKDYYIKAFKREARRLVGNSKFNQVINFESNSIYLETLKDYI